MNWMAAEPTRGRLSAFVKIRSTGAPLGPVEFEDGLCRAPGEGLFGVAPGQSAVFYDAEGTILCGGVIRPR
jgi:tRNA U34 2-thiouridine synthase MnmA/TrmU